MNAEERATLDRLLASDTVIDTVVLATGCDDREMAKSALTYLMTAISDGENAVYAKLPCGFTAHDMLYTHLILMAMTNPVVALTMGTHDHGRMIQDLMGHMYQFGYAVGKRDGELARMVNTAIGGES